MFIYSYRMIIYLYIFPIIISLLQVTRSSLVYDEISQENEFISKYCPETSHCPEGTHVRCLYYDKSEDQSCSPVTLPEWTTALLFKFDNVNRILCKKSHRIGPRCANYEAIRMTPSLSNFILKSVNDFRSSVATGQEKDVKGNLLPKGYGMIKLQWDNELADNAQLAVDQCLDLNGDLCRATDKFPNAGQEVSYYYNKINNNWNTSDLEENISGALATMKLQGRGHTEMAHPQNVLILRSGTTHIGCGAAAYSSYNYDLYSSSNVENQVVKLVHLVCNFSHRLKSSEVAYRTTHPGEGYSRSCGCPEGYKEFHNCLCQQLEFYTRPAIFENQQPSLQMSGTLQAQLYPQRAQSDRPEPARLGNESDCDDSNDFCMPQVMWRPVLPIRTSHPRNTLKDGKRVRRPVTYGQVHFVTQGQRSTKNDIKQDYQISSTHQTAPSIVTNYQPQDVKMDVRNLKNNSTQATAVDNFVKKIHQNNKQLKNVCIITSSDRKVIQFSKPNLVTKSYDVKMGTKLECYKNGLHHDNHLTKGTNVNKELKYMTKTTLISTNRIKTSKPYIITRPRDIKMNNSSLKTFLMNNSLKAKVVTSNMKFSGGRQTKNMSTKHVIQYDEYMKKVLATTLKEPIVFIHKPTLAYTIRNDFNDLMNYINEQSNVKLDSGRQTNSLKTCNKNILKSKQISQELYQPVLNEKEEMQTLSFNIARKPYDEEKFNVDWTENDNGQFSKYVKQSNKYVINNYKTTLRGYKELLVPKFINISKSYDVENDLKNYMTVKSKVKYGGGRLASIREDYDDLLKKLQRDNEHTDNGYEAALNERDEIEISKQHITTRPYDVSDLNNYKTVKSNVNIKAGSQISKLIPTVPYDIEAEFNDLKNYMKVKSNILNIGDLRDNDYDDMSNNVKLSKKQVNILYTTTKSVERQTKSLKPTPTLPHDDENNFSDLKNYMEVKSNVPFNDDMWQNYNDNFPKKLQDNKNSEVVYETELNEREEIQPELLNIIRQNYNTEKSNVKIYDEVLVPNYYPLPNEKINKQPITLTNRANEIHNEKGQTVRKSSEPMTTRPYGFKNYLMKNLMTVKPNHVSSYSVQRQGIAAFSKELQYDNKDMNNINDIKLSELKRRKYNNDISGQKRIQSPNANIITPPDNVKNNLNFIKSIFKFEAQGFTSLPRGVEQDKNYVKKVRESIQKEIKTSKQKIIMLIPRLSDGEIYHKDLHTTKETTNDRGNRDIWIHNKGNLLDKIRQGNKNMRRTYGTALRKVNEINSPNPMIIILTRPDNVANKHIDLQNSLKAKPNFRYDMSANNYDSSNSNDDLVAKYIREILKTAPRALKAVQSRNQKVFLITRYVADNANDKNYEEDISNFKIIDDDDDL